MEKLLCAQLLKRKLMFKKLLVAVDGSSHSIKAVKVVAELAHQLKSCIVILHVIRDLPLPKEI